MNAQSEGERRTTVLLVCPTFFSYHRSIIDEIESRGLKVIWWNDRPYANPVYKAALRLFPRVVGPLSNRTFARRAAALPGADIGQVLVVKGEALSRTSVKALRAVLPNARFCYYLWDGVENVRGARHIAPLFDQVATFDPRDAQRFGWKHRPLFARRVEGQVALRHSNYDWTFVGTLHSDRLRVLRCLLANGTGHRDVFAFGFVPGRLMLAWRYLTDSAMWQSEGVQIATTPMSPGDVHAIVESSAAVVDIEHPRQRGLTMRTIETLLAGRKLITTNAHVRDSDLYDPSRICVIDRKAPRVPPEFLISRFEPVSAESTYRYTLRGWLDELLPRTN